MAHRRTHMISPRKDKPWFLLGLFLICMCGLMLQIIETRILSVISWYHLAFFSISMAMFGMTAGSLVVYFKEGWFAAERLCDCCRGFSTPPDLDRVDDRREARISDDGAVLVQADRHSGGALLLRGNGNIAGADAKPLAS